MINYGWPFSDYDVLEASSDDDNNFNDDEKDPDVTIYGVKKQKIKRDPPPLTNPFMLRELGSPLLNIVPRGVWTKLSGRALDL